MVHLMSWKTSCSDMKAGIKRGHNLILRPVEKIVLNEKNKLLFIRPKTDNLFSTYRPSKLRPSENSRESDLRREQNSDPMTWPDMKADINKRAEMYKGELNGSTRSTVVLNNRLNLDLIKFDTYLEHEIENLTIENK